jgi:hypothetical protein
LRGIFWWQHGWMAWDGMAAMSDEAPRSGSECGWDGGERGGDRTTAAVARGCCTGDMVEPGAYLQVGQHLGCTSLLGSGLGELHLQGAGGGRQHGHGLWKVALTKLTRAAGACCCQLVQMLVMMCDLTLRVRRGPWTWQHTSAAKHKQARCRTLCPGARARHTKRVLLWQAGWPAGGLAAGGSPRRLLAARSCALAPKLMMCTGA